MVIAQEDADGHRTLNEARTLVRDGSDRDRPTRLAPAPTSRYRPGTRHPERAVVHLTDPARKPLELGVEILDLLPARRRRRLPARRPTGSTAPGRAAAGPTAAVYDLSDPAAHPMAAFGVTDHSARFTARRPGRPRDLRARQLRPARPERLHRLSTPSPPSTSTRGEEDRHGHGTTPPHHHPRPRGARAAASPPGSTPGCPAPKVAGVTRPRVQRHVQRDAALRHRAPRTARARLRVAARRRPGRVHRSSPSTTWRRQYRMMRLRRRAHRPPRPARAVAGGGSRAARGAVLRDGARRGPGAARRHAVHVRGQLAARRERRGARRTWRRPRSRCSPGCTTSPAPEAEFLDPTGEGSPLRRHVDAQRAYYDWVVDGLPRSPLIERAFARLEEHWPADEGDGRPQLGRRPHRQHHLRRLRAGGRPRLGDGGATPRARSTSAGPSTCTASSRT